ncbi:hypothetical protein EIP91_010574 [Steccherinum ochraceum]|uniref:Uncharacterized protein n=1 Tax=Steccherinum ochraceum TaxID=92696 RepID=A0A4R0RWW3_9APHY|nr:hypothetical protein EIP91_010574 [Steccherinum ochraceum]
MSRSSGSSLFTWTLVLLSSVSLSLAQKGQNLPPHPADPYADPQNDIYNPLRYIASNTLTAISFALVMIVALAQTFFLWRKGGRFMLSMIIACYTFAIGLALRFGLHAQPESKGIYIAEYLFVVLSPCGFIAANYVLLGRISRWVRGDDHLWISPRRITLVFVMSDVVTFLIQAAGGATSTSNDPQVALTGAHIFLAGLALQLASFVVFSVLYVRFLFRVSKYSPSAWTQDSSLPWYRDWRSLATALIVSCIGILIRSVYRTIELSEGYHGKLATTESYFYGLDTLPLFLAIAIYVPFWPGRYLPDVDALKEMEMEAQRGSTGSEEEK